jgi:hypothetical protein
VAAEKSGWNSIWPSEACVFGGVLESRIAAAEAVRGVSPEISFPSREKLSLLGSPLLPEAISGSIDGKLAAVSILTSRLAELSVHPALFILKNCLAAPKVLYLLRTAPAWLEDPKLAEFDTMIHDSLSGITNADISDSCWIQATLPVSRGGLGIRRTEELALPAFLASVFSVADLIPLINPEADLDDIISEPTRRWCHLADHPVPPLFLQKVQKLWDIPLVDRTCKQLLDDAVDNITKARILATATRESGLWLHALPSPSLGNLLDDNTLCISVALRIGAVVCLRHTCRCGSVVETSGHHGLSCKNSADRHSRHFAINDIVKRALGSAHVPAIREPPRLDRDDGKRPDGMSMVPWTYGKALVWDVTCVDTLAQSYTNQTAATVGAAAAQAETRKNTHYQYLAGRYFFVPLAFETFGPWGEAAKSLISAIGQKITEHSGEKRATDFCGREFLLRCSGVTPFQF